MSHCNGWEALERFRVEMLEDQKRFEKLARKFMDLGSFEDAANCIIKADGLKFVLGRIPSQPLSMPAAAEAPKMQFWERIRLHREQKVGYSIVEAAAAADVNASAYANVELGGTPDVFTLVKLCRWMDLSVDQALQDLGAL